MHALREYLGARGEGSDSHVLLYHNQPVKKDLVRGHIRNAGERVGVKVHPHRLRHTMATQLLNADCRITSIQKLLGHKRLNSTMTYARVHDQTAADDYYADMAHIEARLDLVERIRFVLASGGATTGTAVTTPDASQRDPPLPVFVSAEAATALVS